MTFVENTQFMTQNGKAKNVLSALMIHHSKSRDVYILKFISHLIILLFHLSSTVNKDEIEKHLEKKCNSRPPPTPPYFSSNINCTLPSPELEEKVTLSDFSKETFNKLISNVNQWYQQLIPDINTEVMDHMVLKEKK
jgi:hypothetical protein